MASLPDRPDMAQLRRQAKELYRSAAGGDPHGLRRLRTVSENTTSTPPSWHWQESTGSIAGPTCVRPWRQHGKPAPAR